MKDIYCFGICKVCKKMASLKNGYCPRCERYGKIEVPDFLTDIFDNFKKG